jgi:hypothetical protein
MSRIPRVCALTPAVMDPMPNPLRSPALSLLVLASCLPLGGCFTRQVWNRSTISGNPVEIPEIGAFTPRAEVPYGGGGVAWRSVATPFALAADGGICACLFVYNVVGGSGYDAADWAYRQSNTKQGKTSDRFELANVPPALLPFINRELRDDTGRTLTFLSKPSDQGDIRISGALQVNAKEQVMHTDWETGSFVLKPMGPLFPDSAAQGHHVIASLTFTATTDGVKVSGTYNVSKGPNIVSLGTAYPETLFRPLGPVR